VPPRTGERAHGPRIRRGADPNQVAYLIVSYGDLRLFPDRRAPFAANLVLHHLWGPLPRLGRIGTIGRWVLRVTREVIQ
jgi:hypothetical protein